MATRASGAVDAGLVEAAEDSTFRVAPVVVPCVRAIPSGWNPLRALAAVEDLPDTLFLESGGAVGVGSEWTILAFDPVWRLELRDGALRRVEGSRVETLEGDPLVALAQAWPEAATLEPRPPVPFTSGLAGYLAYELKDWIERYPRNAAREIDLPDLSLGFYDVVWAWNRGTGEAWCVSTGLPERDAGIGETRARERLLNQWGILEPAQSSAATRSQSAAPRSASAPIARLHQPGVTSNFTRDAYLRMVERALEHIAAGDIYQVNLAQRFLVEPAPPLPELYRSLREVSPAPFLAYLSLTDGGIASSSPERFFRIEGDRIETWPIKGTRPRGATPTEDQELQAALRVSPKDRAENVMIVDLERNDLGRICEIGSIRVPALFEISSHSNVHHLVSRVEGRVRPGVTPVDLIRALFPGGSITGAPKIRAVEIIDDLEPVQRGVYTGAIGYWDVSGDCDWNIAIRTIVAAGGAATFHAGGGIVADSTPEAEYEETLVKARGMMRALGVTWKG
ncbi:MAG: aminodeoxychorismate synthase component I [Candidatus Eisenbacteria bacterium]|uniref:aminodeoxychorismate synthase n=1 Tax=Eiseniibacteriota bacterium TaxID=2212470 RepID=A0A538TGV0_UNCEI|nr:MAG: aminodeoxychorismate synthase component I [Candidatus Eisenbacteria bacterium]